MIDWYYLDGKVARKANSYDEAMAKWSSEERAVALTVIGDTCVSTRFMGIDLSLGYDAPVMFETMVIGGKFDGVERRCATWEEAEAQHKEVLEIVKNG